MPRHLRLDKGMCPVEISYENEQFAERSVPEDGGFEVSTFQNVVSVPFFCGGVPLERAGVPVCHLTLASAGSMRFRWNEVNSVRERFFSRLCGDSSRVVVPLELMHSKAVYAAALSPENEPMFVAGTGCAGLVPLRTGDGVVTRERRLVPVVTVADCVPVYLYDPEEGCFGVVHSGWKGTGIAANAVSLACSTYRSLPENFCVVIGPHIHGCCYVVDEERARLFASRYGSDCILRDAAGDFHLSLSVANINLLVDCGVRPENILHCTDCTCCDDRLGSFRRQTACLSQDIPMEKRLRQFTAMAAFVM